MKRRRPKKSRHKISLSDSLDFTHEKEIALRRRMERHITVAFPNKIERREYIENLIKGLDKLIKENQE